MKMSKLRKKILAFIGPLITGKNLQILKIRPRILLNLLKGLKKNIVVKMICLNSLHLRTEKKLTFITLKIKDKERAINFKKSIRCFIPEQENQFFLCSCIWINVPKNKRCNPCFKKFYRRC